MKVMQKIINYFCYCGVTKEEYRNLKKDAYISNFEVWRVLHCGMAIIFAALFVGSLVVDIMKDNMIFYILTFAYSAVAAILFLFVFKKDSLIAQLMMYLSISLLFVFAGFITQNKPQNPSTTFIALLIISPMFMIDKPYFMAIELLSASIIFLIWMHAVKPIDVWKIDAGNVVIFVVVGIFIHIIASSIRIKEFVLAREIKIQKDLDELTGLKNKAAITREINDFLLDNTKNKGMMFLLDINHFKDINDTYGHDIGDSVIHQLGTFLLDTFKDGELCGRFGGDEFIIFVEDTDEEEVAISIAKKIIDGASAFIKLPDTDKKISVSMGISIYQGQEKNYSEIFKKADVALYKTKADRTINYAFYNE